jgi:sterol desaturase/sphingolipid hydroxylase (fatty acid hydroxylase superfamily)
VGWSQILFGAVLVLVLLFVAVLYTVRQVVALRRLRAAEEMALEERAYLHGRAWRRLVTSLLLFLLGIMLAGALLYLETPAQQLAEEQAAKQQQGDTTPLAPEQRKFARLYAWFWIFFLLILMVVVFLAALDYWATRCYGIRQHRKIIDDRRAMIEREVSRLRQERNGPS